MKKIARIILTPVLVIVLGAGGFLGWLTAAEYRPAPVEPAERGAPIESVSLHNIEFAAAEAPRSIKEGRSLSACGLC